MHIVFYHRLYFSFLALINFKILKDTFERQNKLLRQRCYFYDFQEMFPIYYIRLDNVKDWLSISYDLRDRIRVSWRQDSFYCLTKQHSVLRPDSVYNIYQYFKIAKIVLTIAAVLILNESLYLSIFFGNNNVQINKTNFCKQ